MSFFGKSLSRRRIEIDSEATHSNSPDVLKRLDRIQHNYLRLDVILTQLEAQFDLDEQSHVDRDLGHQDETPLPRNPK